MIHDSVDDDVTSGDMTSPDLELLLWDGKDRDKDWRVGREGRESCGRQAYLTFGSVMTQSRVQLKNFPVYLSNGCTDLHQISFNF